MRTRGEWACQTSSRPRPSQTASWTRRPVAIKGEVIRFPSPLDKRFWGGRPNDTCRRKVGSVESNLQSMSGRMPSTTPVSMADPFASQPGRPFFSSTSDWTPRLFRTALPVWRENGGTIPTAAADTQLNPSSHQRGLRGRVRASIGLHVTMVWCRQVQSPFPRCQVTTRHDLLYRRQPGIGVSIQVLSTYQIACSGRQCGKRRIAGAWSPRAYPGREAKGGNQDQK
ncbi:hypothetical protein QBC33DRAFT_132901 [Phialemonium atrogriseum]|uniref:Uncharacterized protein n=1 Tax=Phialemonium atrogriseum TaxID=1093897 RepID=A0AAJ0BZ04_9PEZI|nr:uncharacterized protein QBC33DRAFT_132901 [Phialemonium atrogriseum]KAK1765724.1 hypothetical protein QBC33DRAFT_132901 [Phialemonium atrogriseum]